MDGEAACAYPFGILRTILALRSLDYGGPARNFALHQRGERLRPAMCSIGNVATKLA